MQCTNCETGVVSSEDEYMCDACYNAMLAEVERTSTEYVEWFDNLSVWQKVARQVEGTINRTKHAIQRARH